MHLASFCLELLGVNQCECTNTGHTNYCATIYNGSGLAISSRKAVLTSPSPPLHPVTLSHIHVVSKRRRFTQPHYVAFSDRLPFSRKRILPPKHPKKQF